MSLPSCQFTWSEDIVDNQIWLVEMFPMWTYVQLSDTQTRTPENHLRVKLVYDVFEKFNKFPRISSAKIKSNEDAENFRKVGNELYTKGRLLVAALEQYTKSIAHAEDKTPTLALAYANRSAALFRMKYYVQCLEDIQLALNNNYPKHLMGKLKSRKTQAMKLVQKESSAKFHDKLPVIMNKNSLIKCAADCVEIRKSPEFGRHVVATRDIKFGEVISVEEPYVCQILPSPDNLLYCHQCFELCYNLIPCTHCSQALYCSKRCKHQAMQDYHKYECQLLQHNVNTCYLFVKLTLKCLDEYENFEKDSDMEGIYCSHRYKEIFHLKSDIRLLTLLDIVGIAHVLHFFKKCTNILNKIDEIKFRKLLCHNLVIHPNVCSCDVTIGDIGDAVSGRELLLTQPIGAGLFSFLSLFNHSCNPNVTRNSYGSYMVTQAVSHIKKGQQCFISYGPSFDDFPREERIVFLQGAYNFICKCEACSRNWPMINTLRRSGNPFLMAYTSALIFQLTTEYKTDTSVIKKFLSKVSKLVEVLEKRTEPCLELTLIKINVDICFMYLANNRFNLRY